MTELVKSFPPVLPENPRILILGSMPGAESLRWQQYYAHSQNMFWKVMSAIVPLLPSAAYDKRIAGLKKGKIALWDTLKFCERKGSLDSGIRRGTETPNDICGLLKENPSVRAVFFNGKKAGQVFRTHITPQMDERTSRRLHFETLPSTSPANAAVAGKLKIGIWEKSIKPFLQNCG